MCAKPQNCSISLVALQRERRRENSEQYDASLGGVELWWWVFLDYGEWGWILENVFPNPGNSHWMRACDSRTSRAGSEGFWASFRDCLWLHSAKYLTAVLMLIGVIIQCGNLYWMCASVAHPHRQPFAKDFPWGRVKRHARWMEMPHSCKSAIDHILHHISM